MTLLVISPDYASHLFPLATLATAWRDVGQRVVVATGPATAAIARDFGFDVELLPLGRGSNPGVIRAEEQPPGEDEALRGFFAATRRGPAETLSYQARARRDDLLWDPLGTARRVQGVVDRVRPDEVIVDHLAFAARLALTGAGIRHADVVLGHPSALTVADEVYGHPPAWPGRLRPAPAELEALHRLCSSVRDEFTEQWNDALQQIAPGTPASADAFAETGDDLLLNYPGELHDEHRTRALPEHTFLGSAVREEAEDPEVAAWLAGSDRPVVYISLGSFLSVRGDVLSRVAEALRGLDVRVALAPGSTRPSDLGPVPESWLVRGTLPQVTLLHRASVAVSHGGNNSVTEALTAGVPLLLLPMSTDQFAGAAALEAAGVGTVLDPNALTTAEVREAVAGLLDEGHERRGALEDLRHDLTLRPGPQRAFAALVG